MNKVQIQLFRLYVSLGPLLCPLFCPNTLLFILLLSFRLGLLLLPLFFVCSEFPPFSREVEKFLFFVMQGCSVERFGDLSTTLILLKLFLVSWIPCLL